MKKLLFLALLLLPVQGWGTSITRVSGSIASKEDSAGGCFGPTCSITIQAPAVGDLIVFTEQCGNSTEITAAPTDSAGNTYTAFTADNSFNDFNPSNGNHGESAWYGYSVVTVAGATSITYKDASGADCRGGTVQYHSTNGWAANPEDHSAVNLGAASAATFTSNATATLSQASEVGVGVIDIKAASGIPNTVADNSPWSNLTTTNDGSSVQHRMSENIVSATTALTYSGTLSPNDDYGASVMTFKDQPPAAPTPSGTLTIR